MHDAAISRDTRFRVGAETDLLKQQLETEKERASYVRAQAGAAAASSAASYAAAKRHMSETEWRNLQLREAKPVGEGGYGRGTGVGPDSRERLIRNVQDSLTEIGI